MEVRELIIKLLESIAAKRLVILAGAGLSVVTPSNVPAAAAVANRAYREHQKVTAEILPKDCEWNLENIASHFYAENRLANYFVARLVDWTKFRTSPNRGHLAIADLLGCGAIDFALTTNFDDLVERAAERLGDQNFRASLDGREARAQTKHRPYLKVYGCCAREPATTLWCHPQTSDAQVKERLGFSADWLRANLLDRDLLVVGFWSDWSYLNDILERALPPGSDGHVYVLDRDDPEKLKDKAPLLWSWAELHRSFAHVRAEADGVLEELRYTFSKILIGRVMDGRGVEAWIDSLSCDDAYAFRSDLAGPKGIARDADPDQSMSAFAHAHARLLNSGAEFAHGHYVVGERRIRVVQAAGRLLSDVRAEIESAPAIAADLDVLLCAGALDDGDAAANILRTEQTATIIRSGTEGLSFVTLAEILLNDNAS